MQLVIVVVLVTITAGVVEVIAILTEPGRITVAAVVLTATIASIAVAEAVAVVVDTISAATSAEVTIVTGSKHLSPHR